MSGSFQARITSLEDHFDPNYPLQTWDEEDEHLTASVGKHPYNPKPTHTVNTSYSPSPYSGQTPSWPAGPNEYSGVRAQEYESHSFDVHGIISPLERRQSRASDGFFDSSQQLHTPSQAPSVNQPSIYTIPAPPPPPHVPDPDYQSYDPTRLSVMDTSSNHSRQRSHLGVKRQGSILSRVGTRIMGTVKGRRTGTMRRHHTTRKTGEGGDADYMELTGKHEDSEEVEAIGYDVSTYFGPEFVVPEATLNAMKKSEFDENLAYTGWYSLGRAVYSSQY